MSAVSAEPPAGHGALELRSTRSVLLAAWSRNPARTMQANEPQGAIDGTPVAFGWGRWHYPLPPGEYEFTAWTRHQKPEDAVRTTVEIREGQVTRLDYVTSLTSLRPSALGPPPQPLPGRRAPLYRFLIIAALILLPGAIGTVIGILTG
ncbi:hypothetical protein HUT06_33665 [Actinomadura sp. NAK00032]|uniref:hypothetical protein n=1 Tax=Actinomadura sp. NAK00032 TaxID=2742128 RepID=UPI001591D952|nr:hypothetical protein [Actinomadura sp. NAK00032]QKW38349.1 hypothetical protein HUT06_33665 [Actinomadura sp. NAK00032]